MTTTSTSHPESLRRRQGLTEQAAQAAIDQACRRLRLPTIRTVVDDAVTAATKEQLTYQGFLAELLLAEVDDRDRRSTLRRIKSAGFPREKWLADFDFTANPNINPATINELGYLELDRRGAELLFQVLTEREEKNAIAIASNQSFSAWTDTFTDPRLCAAIVDRLTYNATIIETGTNSYRLAHTRARASVMG